LRGLTDNPDVRQLGDAIARRQAILFVGGGLSMVLGLPSWSELVDHMLDELGLKDNHTAGMEFSYQTLAEYYRLQQGSIGPLRSWMDRTWSVPESRIRESKAHRIIVDLDFPIIYTTNYDTNLEVAFRLHGRNFTKISNARDLAKVSNGITQIVKFHGDFDEDSSLVIAETDYFERLAFETPLDIKFRADALGKTLVFIGYSLSDLNIRSLFQKLLHLPKHIGEVTTHRAPLCWFIRCGENVRLARIELALNSPNDPVAWRGEHLTLKRLDGEPRFIDPMDLAESRKADIGRFEFTTQPLPSFDYHWLLAELHGGPFRGSLPWERDATSLSRDVTGGV